MQKTILLIIAALGLAACATKPAAPSTPPPLWVHDLEAAYPRAEWLTALETGRTKKHAEDAALAALAGGFRIDVAAITNSSLAFVQTVEKSGEKNVSALSEFRSLAQDVRASSDVAGLIGVERDFWTAPAGEVHALIRMNRAQSASRYLARITENETIIEKLSRAAGERPGTLEAYANLAAAAPLAAVTDGLISILSVIMPEKAAYRPSYAGAATLNARLNDAAGRITARLVVKGDVNGRIENALTKVLTARGFRVGSSGAVCTLNVTCSVEDSPQGEGGFVYARIMLNAALSGADGKEIFAWSDNDRQGHATLAGAKERALAKAEARITETGFAAALDTAFAAKISALRE